MMTSLESAINTLFGAAVGTGVGLLIGLQLRAGLR
jgi:ABC-type antimicrobial peptide transport system permease subunit